MKRIENIACEEEWREEPRSNAVESRERVLAAGIRMEFVSRCGTIAVNIDLEFGFDFGC